MKYGQPHFLQHRPHVSTCDHCLLRQVVTSLVRVSPLAHGVPLPLGAWARENQQQVSSSGSGTRNRLREREGDLRACPRDTCPSFPDLGQVGEEPPPLAARLGREARRWGRDIGEPRSGRGGQRAQSEPTPGLTCVSDNPRKQPLLAPGGAGVSQSPWPGVPRGCRCCLGANEQGGAGRAGQAGGGRAQAWSTAPGLCSLPGGSFFWFFVYLFVLE